VKVTQADLRRYAQNYLKEQDGIALYRAMSEAEDDPSRAEIFEKLAVAEERHAAKWANLLKANGAPIPSYTPGSRVRVLGWFSRHFGTQHVLPVVSGFELRDQDAYAGQREAGGMSAEERAHSRTLRVMHLHGETRPESILNSDRFHRSGYSGALRAAVFGVNDGLISNFGLVMGVSAANVDQGFVLLTGVAGLLAGAFSMGAGEYVSVRSQRELYEEQIALEQQELEMSPAEEKEELALIYQAKGISSAQAEELADKILSNPETAIDTLAREELGLDPASLGSPWEAAGSSFISFAVGAAIPVLPYVIFDGGNAFLISAGVCGLALFAVGALISVFTGKTMLYSGLRMLGIGALAAGITFAIGRLLGVSIAG
jgi:VIT1/CCC1 family predicted Fe2+/Mn2+ transporter